MKKSNLFIIGILTLFIAGCDSSDKKENVSAPTSISGLTVEITVESGSGGFATTGSADFITSNINDTYTIDGDTINIADSAGTYTYSTNNNKATIAFDDATLGKGNFFLTFTTSTASGSYTADIEQNPSAAQSGTFIIN